MSTATATAANVRRLPATLDPAEVTVVVDTREQLPFDMEPMNCERGGLATEDYSIRGLEELVCVERKELEDLIACLGRDRERFGRELQRMKAYPTRCVVVEASWSDLEAGNYTSRLQPQGGHQYPCLLDGPVSGPVHDVGKPAERGGFHQKVSFP